MPSVKAFFLLLAAVHSLVGLGTLLGSCTVPGLAVAIQKSTGTAQAVAARTLQRLWVSRPELQASILQATAGNRLWLQLLARPSSSHAADTAAQMLHSIAAGQQQPLDTDVPPQQPPHSTSVAPLQPPGQPGAIGTHLGSPHLEQWTCALPTPQELARALCQPLCTSACQNYLLTLLPLSLQQQVHALADLAELPGLVPVLLQWAGLGDHIPRGSSSEAGQVASVLLTDLALYPFAAQQLCQEGTWTRLAAIIGGEARGRPARAKAAAARLVANAAVTLDGQMVACMTGQWEAPTPLTQQSPEDRLAKPLLGQESPTGSKAKLRLALQNPGASLTEPLMAQLRMLDGLLQHGTQEEQIAAALAMQSLAEASTAAAMQLAQQGSLQALLSIATATSSSALRMSAALAALGLSQRGVAGPLRLAPTELAALRTSAERTDQLVPVQILHSLLDLAESSAARSQAATLPWAPTTSIAICSIQSGACHAVHATVSGVLGPSIPQLVAERTSQGIAAQLVAGTAAPVVTLGEDLVPQARPDSTLRLAACFAMEAGPKQAESSAWMVFRLSGAGAGSTWHPGWNVLNNVGRLPALLRLADLASPGMALRSWLTLGQIQMTDWWRSTVKPAASLAMTQAHACWTIVVLPPMQAAARLILNQLAAVGNAAYGWLLVPLTQLAQGIWHGIFMPALRSLFNIITVLVNAAFHALDVHVVQPLSPIVLDHVLRPLASFFIAFVWPLLCLVLAATFAYAHLRDRQPNRAGGH